IRQVLINLVGNALKFTDEGRIEIRVKVDAKDGDTITLRWQVEDTGIGISEANQQIIFDAFVQADSSVSRKYGGTGLGLTIAHNLVQLMDGWIWLKSEPGAGSRFTFNIKVEVSQDKEILAAASRNELLNDIPILIVDDNSANRKILARMVEHWKLRPTTAASASSAIDRLLRAYQSDRPYKLALIDYAMPECNGLELVEQIRSDQRISATEIIMISSVKEPALAQHARELKVANIIIKPVSEPELITAILKAIEKVRRLKPVPTAPVNNEPRIFKILIAEDDRINQIILRRLLEKRGHTCTVVSDGQAVLEELRHTEYDAIIMDVQMPVMDGMTTTLIIRAQEEETGDHIPIIASTAYAIKGDKEHLIKTGMDSYTSKPYSALELYTTVETTCRNSSGSGRDVSQQLLSQKSISGLFGNDRELLKEAVDSLLEEIPIYCEKLDQFVIDLAYRDLEILAHSIKGAMANFRAEAAAMTASQLEEAAVKNDRKEIESLQKELKKSLNTVASLLKDYMKDHD
ncbi:MAG: response regulator, partial [Candidatus Obscuribacterales bacterium]|nr:response regulator [Candidatus Obscuribacterales bacterium]